MEVDEWCITPLGVILFNVKVSGLVPSNGFGPSRVGVVKAYGSLGCTFFDEIKGNLYVYISGESHELLPSSSASS